MPSCVYYTLITLFLLMGRVSTDKPPSCSECSPAPSRDNRFIPSHNEKAQRNTKTTRALYVMLVNHLSHYIVFVQADCACVPQLRNEHRYLLMTVQNTLIKRLTQVRLCCGLTYQFTNRMHRGEPTYFSLLSRTVSLPRGAVT